MEVEVRGGFSKLVVVEELPLVLGHWELCLVRVELRTVQLLLL
jgi:hypothetical protein